jgi:hypothetical protein
LRCRDCSVTMQPTCERFDCFLQSDHSRLRCIRVEGEQEISSCGPRLQLASRGRHDLRQKGGHWSAVRCDSNRAFLHAPLAAHCGGGPSQLWAHRGGDLKLEPEGRGERTANRCLNPSPSIPVPCYGVSSFDFPIADHCDVTSWSNGKIMFKMRREGLADRQILQDLRPTA